MTDIADAFDESIYDSVDEGIDVIFDSLENYVRTITDAPYSFAFEQDAAMIVLFEIMLAIIATEFYPESKHDE